MCQDLCVICTIPMEHEFFGVLLLKAHQPCPLIMMKIYDEFHSALQNVPRTGC